MSTTRYYRATCGSLYRVTHTPARPATKTSKATAAATIQARRSTHAITFRGPLWGKATPPNPQKAPAWLASAHSPKYPPHEAHRPNPARPL